MKYAFLILSTFTTLFVSAMDINPVTPPDSTTSIVDKSAAIYIIEEGKTLYNDRKYRDALIKFRQASVKDPNSWKAAYWVGKSHYMMHNYGYALKYAKQALELGDEKVGEEIHVLLGSTYHRLGKIDSALVNYDLALHALTEARSKTLMIQHHIDECNFALEEMKKESYPERVKLQGEINSGYDDYSVLPTNDKNVVYFTSRRPNTTGGGMNPDDQVYFEDIYKAQYDPETNSWDSITNELGKINTNGHERITWISPDGTWGVSTLNTAGLNEKKTTKGADICEIKMTDKGTWNSAKPIKNKKLNTSFAEMSATLTADGNTMYFVSDRKGDKSSTDIYVVTKNGNKWGDPKQLPMNVNTERQETTPFITPDGRYLFFSSDGHVGMGGYDIYVTENLGDSWSDPVNLGIGVNSVNNDLFFVYMPDEKKAYFSATEIIGNKASYDVFEIDMTDFKYPTMKK